MPRYRLLSAHFSEEDKWLPGDKENESTDAPDQDSWLMKMATPSMIATGDRD
jgi:hypothetical protein